MQDLYDPPKPPSQVIYDFGIEVIYDPDDYISGDRMNDTDIEGLGYSIDNENYPIESYDPLNGWSGTASSGYVISRYSVPKVIDEGQKHVGVCFAGEGDLSEPSWYLIFPNQYPLRCDEFALVIY